MAKKVLLETAKNTIAFTVKAHDGDEKLSQFDADVLALCAQIPVPDMEKLDKTSPTFDIGNPRRLLASLATRYSGIDVKAVTGRLKYFNARGFLGKVTAAGLIGPGWYPTPKLISMVAKLKTAAEANPAKHQLNIDISVFDAGVNEETLSKNGRYKVAQKKSSVISGDVSEMTVE